MKATKKTFFIGILFALAAAVFTGCSDSETTKVEVTDGSENFNSDLSYKVEIGKISYEDYQAYMDWYLGNTHFTKETYAAAYQTEKALLISQTIDGTYEDKGTLTASSVKSYLMQNGQDEDEANSSLTTAEVFGSDITTCVKIANNTPDITWVYIEKITQQ